MNPVAKYLLTLCACGALTGFGAAAQAHNAQFELAKWKPQYAQAPLNIQKWYGSQHNARGGYCCDKADGHAYYDNYQLNKDGSVTLANGTHIPQWQVLSGPNPTGHAVWWHNSDLVSYCFAPGSLI